VQISIVDIQIHPYYVLIICKKKIKNLEEKPTWTRVGETYAWTSAGGPVCPWRVFEKPFSLVRRTTTLLPIGDIERKRKTQFSRITHATAAESLENSNVMNVERRFIWHEVLLLPDVVQTIVITAFYNYQYNSFVLPNMLHEFYDTKNALYTTCLPYSWITVQIKFNKM